MTFPLVPVTVIGGFLGSGKTTLLNQVLHGAPGVRYAVMVNDFGSLAIDEALIRSHDGDTISFANGCVCCSVSDNLVSSIDKLLERNPVPEHFLIEISGVANPKIVADVATLHPALRRDLIITLADAETVMERLNDERLKDTLAMQLSPADVIVLNKSDLVASERLNHIHQELEQRFAGHVVLTVEAELPAGLLSAAVLDIDEQASKPEALSSGNWRHDPEAQFYRLSVELPPQLRRTRLVSILREYQPLLLRAKGFVIDDKSETLMSIQLSGKQIDIQPWTEEKQQLHRPVLVAIGSQPLKEFEQAIAVYY